MEYYRIFEPKNVIRSRYTRIDGNIEYAPICPICKRGGGRINLPSIQFKDKKPLGDFSWMIADVFVNQTCKTALEALGDADFFFEEVEVLGKRRENIWLLNVTSRCNFAPENRVELLESCYTCGMRRFSTWDGGIKINGSCQAGVFRLSEHPGSIFVNSTVKDYLLSQKLTNIEFIKTDEILDEFAFMRQRKS